MKTYSGKYKVKNPKKYKGDFNNIIYRSMWEKWCFMWCDENNSIVEWSSEEIVIPYYYDVDKKYHRYFIDLKIKFAEGTVLLIEIKPEKQTKPPVGKRKTKQYIKESLTYVKNMNKWNAASEYAKDRGWKFEIWTEKELENLNIMPKSANKIKSKLKPMPKFKKRK